MNTEAEKIILELKQILYEIERYRKWKKIGYIFTPVIWGFLILKRANRNLDDLEFLKKQLLDKVILDIEKLIEDNEKLFQRDSYLIFSELMEALSQIDISLNCVRDFQSKRHHFDYNFNNFINSSIEKIKEQKIRINEYNTVFVKQRKEKYSYLFNKDSMTLDDDQQTAIITDDKHNLVVAGAGSGKTEVLITRIAYLIERNPDTIKPNKILALAFQNKAANEIRERLKKRYGIDVEIKTFHSLGKKIIDDAAKLHKNKKKPRLMFDGDNAERDYRNYILDIFKNKMVADSQLQKDLIHFIKS
jgi:DNA helicase-4